MLTENKCEVVTTLLSVVLSMGQIMTEVIKIRHSINIENMKRRTIATSPNRAAQGSFLMHAKRKWFINNCQYIPLFEKVMTFKNSVYAVLWHIFHTSKLQLKTLFKLIAIAFLLYIAMQRQQQWKSDQQRIQRFLNDCPDRF